MMQHSDTRTFLRHYLARRVTVDTLAIVRGLEPQDDLIHAACRMNRSIDPRRPRKLTPAQASSVNDTAEIRGPCRRSRPAKELTPRPGDAQ